MVTNYCGGFFSVQCEIHRAVLRTHKAKNVFHMNYLSSTLLHSWRRIRKLTKTYLSSGLELWQGIVIQSVQTPSLPPPRASKVANQNVLLSIHGCKSSGQDHRKCHSVVKQSSSAALKVSCDNVVFSWMTDRTLL